MPYNKSGTESKSWRFAFLGLVICSPLACDSESQNAVVNNCQQAFKTEEEVNKDAMFITDEQNEIGNVKFAVFADPHVYDLNLGTVSKAFKSYVLSDRKMLVESIAIMESMVDLILAERVNFVLVPGDLTKDGVRSSHEVCAEYLADIEKEGIPVLVVPGNHDVDNRLAQAYPIGSKAVTVGGISPVEFENIYSAFGYEDAIARDPNSLSYIAEPVKGIWIFALDSCNYDKRFPDLKPIQGDLSEETMQWIAEQLEAAAEEGVIVVGMMHHGIVEHYPQMEAFDKRFLVQDWQYKADRFAADGLGLVFTGHHHAQDISKRESTGDFMIDIQTGSTITWPSPYRIVSLNPKERTLSVKTELITSITHDLYGYTFQDYAYQSLMRGLDTRLLELLELNGVDEEDAEFYLPLIGPTLVAYYQGDEPLQKGNDPLIGEIETLGASDDEIGALLAEQMLGVWNDDTPDNNVTLNLITGELIGTD